MSKGRSAGALGAAGPMALRRSGSGPAWTPGRGTPLVVIGHDVLLAECCPFLRVPSEPLISPPRTIHDYTTNLTATSGKGLALFVMAPRRRRGRAVVVRRRSSGRGLASPSSSSRSSVSRARLMRLFTVPTETPVCCGDDLVGQALEDRQQQRLTLRRRKLGEGRHELAHHQAAVLMRRMRQRFGDRGVDRHGRALAAQAGNELVALDAEQPRRQVGARLEAVASGQRLDDGVVDQVICRVAIARQRQCVDPKPRKDRLQLLVEVANVVARLGRP